MYNHSAHSCESEITQPCLTLCHPMDCSLPASSVHGIFQERILEWVVISFSKRSSQLRDWTGVFHIVGRRFILPSEPPGKLWVKFYLGQNEGCTLKAASEIALRGFSKAAVGGGQYIRFQWRGSSTSCSTHFTKGFLLIMRIWCQHEGI